MLVLLQGAGRLFWLWCLVRLVLLQQFGKVCVRSCINMTLNPKPQDASVPATLTLEGFADGVCIMCGPIREFPKIGDPNIVP